MTQGEGWGRTFVWVARAPVTASSINSTGIFKNVQFNIVICHGSHAKMRTLVSIFGQNKLLQFISAVVHLYNNLLYLHSITLFLISSYILHRILFYILNIIETRQNEIKWVRDFFQTLRIRKYDLFLDRPFCCALRRPRWRVSLALQRPSFPQIRSTRQTPSTLRKGTAPPQWTANRNPPSGTGCQPRG